MTPPNGPPLRDLGADTVDGTSYSMFSETHLESAIRFVQHLEKRPVLF
jgi:hypothetical protein